jgi:threonine dehydrogenase-like Zn-dependent dehydrogenase
MKKLGEFWGRGWAQKAVVVGGGAIMLLMSCCVMFLGVALVVNPPDFEAASRDVATSVAVDLAEDRATAAAFREEAKPTATIRPTDVPTPSATATARPTVVSEQAQREAYLRAINPSFETYIQGLMAVSEATGSFSRRDAGWSDRVRNAAALVILGHRGFTRVNPPPAMAEIHERLINSTQYCAEGSEQLQDAVDMFDAGNIDGTLVIMDRANENINVCNSLLDDLITDLQQ